MRDQVPALQRQVKTPRLSSVDRAILAAFARLLPYGHLHRMRLIISPRTVLRRHADLVRQRRTYPRRIPGRPRAAPALRALVLELARDNPGWGYRRLHPAGITARPAGEWVTQLARNLLMNLEDQAGGLKFLIRDGDAKFTAMFDAASAAIGVRILKTPVQAPRADAIAERW